MSRDPRDRLPDVRDGLTRVERVVLWQLSLLQKERRGRNVPTAMLYGRVVEHVNISVRELQRVLQRMTGGTSDRLSPGGAAAAGGPREPSGPIGHEPHGQS